MFKWLYSIGLAFVSFAWLPKLFKNKYRQTLSARLGRGLSLRSDKPTRIWVHAVSLGETKAVIPLVKQLRALYPDSFFIFSTLTATGLEAAKKEFPEADRHIYLPFDLVSRTAVKEARPTLVLLSETDFWYHFLDESKAQGANIILVNGKLSKGSFALYKWAPTLFQPIDRFLVQNEIYKRRFLALGIPESKISVSGNLKITPLPDASSHPNQTPTLVIGSTHDPEERIFLSALSDVWKKYPELKVYLVPRHPERFETVAKLIESFHIPFSRSSVGDNHKLILVDEMGRLKSLYSQADLCAVGGSWTPKIGGHNILEPAFFGKPVIFGPYMHSQPDFLELVLSEKAGLQVPEASLSSALIHLLTYPNECKALGQAGLALIKKNQGALDKTLAVIQSLC